MEKLNGKDIKYLMLSLGFHRIHSKKRWKMKICDSILINDSDLIHKAPTPAEFSRYLEETLDLQIRSRTTLLRKKRMLLAFFKD